MDRPAGDSLPLAQRTKFDRWLFDRDIDNVRAAEMLDAHPVSVGRWRKRFDDPERRVPPRAKILDIETLTGGDVTLIDWYRPCGVVYVTPADVRAAPAASEDVEAAQ